MSGQDARSSSGYRERNSTADRALDILLLFDDSRLTLSGAQVAEQLGVARSTAYRYLQSLIASGFLEESDSAGYRLGPRVLELARLARKGIGLSEVARPVMRELAAEFDETVLLTRRTGASVVCLEREEANTPIRLSYERGHVLPANAGASALVLLAWEDAAAVESVLAASGLVRFTERTITGKQALLKRLRVIHRQGYAVSRGELDRDVLGIAAPIRGADDAVIAAVSVVALSHRVPDSQVPVVGERVCTAADEITRRLSEVASG